MRGLFPWQLDALAWASQRTRVAFFHEMRLGKTLLSIRWACSRLADRKVRQPAVLVLGPLEVWSSWAYECREEGLKFFRLKGNTDRRMTLIADGLDQPGSRWFFCNTEFLSRTPKKQTCPVLQLNWDAIILDECTCIKNPQAQVTTQIMRYADAPLKAVLSGLPNPEEAWDYYNPMQWLMGGAWMSCKNWYEFRSRFYKQVGYLWRPKPYAYEMIRTGVAVSAHRLRLRDVLPQRRTAYETQTFELDSKTRAAYDKIEKEFAVGEREANDAIVRDIWLSRLPGGSLPEVPCNGKLKLARELLKGPLAERSVLIWCRFNDEIPLLRKTLAFRDPACITGETPVDKRESIRQQFQGGKRNCVILQIKCARFGQDWSRASAAIYYSNNWSLQERKQTEARIQHPSRSTDPLIIDLAAGDTLDEDVVTVLREKKLTANLTDAAFKGLVRQRAKQRQVRMEAKP